MDYLKACLGTAPIYNFNFRELRSLVEASTHALDPSQPTCIVFSLEDGRGSLFKLLRILTTFAKIRFLSIFLSKKYFFMTKAYGIYPTIEQPVVIFEMQSNAEAYVMENILPAVPKGFNGYLRLIVIRLTKINPVLGGIAFVIRGNA